MVGPRWLADEMLGRLARYLRFVGHDALYVRNVSDEEIIERVRREGRTLLTRDRALASRVDGSLLLASADVAEQLRSVAQAFPSAGYEVRFERCSICNGPLVAWSRPLSGEWPPDVPAHLADGSSTIYACSECGHRYWEGFHTTAIRATLTRWLAA